MKIKVKTAGLDAGDKPIIILNKNDAKVLGVSALSRVNVIKGKRKITSIVDISEGFVSSGKALVYKEIEEALNLKNGDIVDISVVGRLESEDYIRKKADGKKLSFREYKKIMQDMKSKAISDIELASFVTSLYINGVDDKEIEYITNVFYDETKALKFPGIVVDKHSIGGIPGDKTSILFVPMISSYGFLMPKTSSRAITDPAGTADRMEVLANVEFSFSDIKKIISKTNACIVWGGNLRLSSVDNMFIRIEKPLSMDPLMIPSILSKKKTMGSNRVVIDIPTGKFGKVKTKPEAEALGKKFVKIGKTLDMKISYAITESKQPLGYSIGPAPEAKEILKIFENPKKAPNDVIVKLRLLSDEMKKILSFKHDFMDSLFSGSAKKKFKEIIEAQGGNSDITSDEIELGKFSHTIFSEKRGKIKELNSDILKSAAKFAGAPTMKKSGIVLNKKVNDIVDKGEEIFTIFSESLDKLKQSVKFLRKNENGVVVKCL